MIRHLTLHVAPHKIYKTFPTKHLNTLNYAKEAKAPAPYRKQKPQMVVNVRCVCCLQCQKNNLRTTTDKVESRDLNFLLSSSSTFGSGSGNLRQCAPFIFIFASFTSKSPELRLPRLVCYASRVCVCWCCPADSSTGGCYIPIIDCQKTIFSKWRGGGPATTSKRKNDVCLSVRIDKKNIRRAQCSERQQREKQNHSEKKESSLGWSFCCI